MLLGVLLDCVALALSPEDQARIPQPGCTCAGLLVSLRTRVGYRMFKTSVELQPWGILGLFGLPGRKLKQP